MLNAVFNASLHVSRGPKSVVSQEKFSIIFSISPGYFGADMFLAGSRICSGPGVGTLRKMDEVSVVSEKGVVDSSVLESVELSPLSQEGDTGHV
jgi:hypothetical protein